MADLDTALHRKVQEVSNLVGRLSEQVGFVSGQVSSVEAHQQQTRTELQQLRDDFVSYVQQAQAIAHVQRAETRIGVIQDKVDHEYGHHKVVRRTAVGLLQGFDTGLVTEDTVRNVSEQLMIQTPRYWLAPALIALASWSADDRALCERAVDEAFRRSPDRTSLFFALVLRRQERRAAAVRWLRHYLLAQDPAALGREFAVILESIAQGAFGAEGRALLTETLGEWRTTLLASDAAEQEQADRWRAEIDSLRAPSAAREFPRLTAVSPQWPQLDSVLGAARGQQVLLDKYQAVMDAPAAPTQRLEDAVDDILDRLVSEYDTEELPLRRELARMQAIVDHDGDMGAAGRQADVDAAAYEETLDYLTVQTTAALNPAAIGTSAATQRLAIAACHEWFARAQAAATRDYRAAVPPDVQAQFGSRHTAGASVFQLPAWYGSFVRPLAELEASLTAHWDRHTAPFLDALAFPWRRRALLPAAVVAGILLVVGQVSVGFALTLAVVVGGVWGLVLRQQSAVAAKAQRAARTALERARSESLTALRAASAELTDWYEKYRRADAVDARCRELIAGLATAVGAGSPFEGRTVDRPREDGGLDAEPAAAGAGRTVRFDDAGTAGSTAGTGTGDTAGAKTPRDGGNA